MEISIIYCTKMFYFLFTEKMWNMNEVGFYVDKKKKNIAYFSS